MNKRRLCCIWYVDYKSASGRINTLFVAAETMRQAVRSARRRLVREEIKPEIEEVGIAGTQHLKPF